MVVNHRNYYNVLYLSVQSSDGWLPSCVIVNPVTSLVWQSLFFSLWVVRGFFYSEAFRNDGCENIPFILLCLKYFIGNPKAFKHCRLLVEPFRSDAPPSFPKSLIGNPDAFKYCGPLVETLRGDG